MAITLSPPHQDLTFMTPLAEDRAADLVAFVACDLTGTVLDVGCGWAELLLRVLAASPNAQGIGVDHDATAIEHGRALAVRRGLLDRLTLEVGDARSTAPDHADAVICVGASQIWGPPVEDRQPMDYRAALTALRRIVDRGARVLYGEGIWSQSPTESAMAVLSGRPDELVTMAQLLELAVEHGFMPIAVHEANLDEWDEFESGYSACYATWIGEHGLDHPDSDEVLAQAAQQRSAYFGGYRGIMGMAYLALVAV